MIHQKTLFRIRTLFFSITAITICFFFCNIQSRAAETEDCLVLVYSEQEGMGEITSSYLGTPFEYSIEVPRGSNIIVTARYYPQCTFEGWYVNGEPKSKELSYSFNADGPMCIASAKFRQNNDYIHKGAKLAISSTSWANRTCRFQEGSGAYNISVTTAMALQGEKCIEAFESVLEDYKIARTYNITFTRNTTQDLETLSEPATFIFQIPKELQSPTRVFRLINVYKGQPTVLKDQDDSNETLTFTSDKAGAYALVYRDVASTIPEPDEAVDPLMSVMPLEP